jgi:hypothetical protein
MEKTVEKLNIPKISKEDFDKFFGILADIKLSKKEAFENIEEIEHTKDAGIE